MTAENPCECCGEDLPIVRPNVLGIGNCCKDCAEGDVVGVRNLRKSGIEGMYNDPSGYKGRWIIKP